ncbi:thiosulfate/3-mercaptopyruvate sulfurtransferase [Gillisia sp. Hel_I_86]|uniref:sulfurtransferase n=1 Tax=Gillisia sp. Hel_I_86 TaxID=1249981 RepID=UPI001199E31A|nr:sulfurtransferase [Gillisia sp. Hel_I_86]TVZ27141.1 thiosulfate/3-mercaptopyruvate sulfurtransferase [Gillisia sp. Hel_I_86]
MVWRISLLCCLLAFSSCKEEKKNKVEVTKNEEANLNISDEDDSKINYLIEVDELLKIANEPNIKILDFRKSEFYANEHIEGAMNIWRTDIEDASYPYKGMMAGKKQMETLFSGLGINTKDTIIIYDDNGLVDSTRLWWILQNYDFTKVRLLHGGITAWKEKNGAISTETPIVKRSNFKLTDAPSMKYLISKEKMIQAVANNTFIIDARTDDEFSGKRQKEGAAKGGRIPNSKSIDWAKSVNYNGDKKMKSTEDLIEIYNKLGASKDDEIIAYCHSGVRSAHTTFVLTQILGYKNVKNYDGSWTEWSQFDDLSFDQDSITTIIE